MRINFNQFVFPWRKLTNMRCVWGDCHNFLLIEFAFLKPKLRYTTPILVTRQVTKLLLFKVLRKANLLKGSNIHVTEDMPRSKLFIV